MSGFAQDQWYVAAYTEEVGTELLARTVCGEPIVFYRKSTGEVIGLFDRCAHRRYPLSEGHLSDDQLVCGYHGFTYDGTGVCTYVPGQKRVPRTARVISYPVAELDSFVWVWIGDPANADVTTIPRAPWMDHENWTTVSGMEPLDARYGLLIDNLLDLSHETYLHGGYIGTPEVAETPTTTEVDETASVVYVSRRMTDVECPSFYARSTGITGRIDRWQDIEYHAPCLYLLHSRIAPTGVAPGADGDDSGAAHAEIVYAVTPSTETTTMDFWGVARDFARDDVSVSEFLFSNNREVVMQDVVALNLLEKVIATEPDGYQELSINIDTGGLAGRRMLQRLTEGVAPIPVPTA